MTATLFHYSLQNRRLASDCELPTLLRAEADGEPLIVFRLRAGQADIERRDLTPWYRTEDIVIDRTADGALIVRFADTTTFLVGGDGRSITLLSAPAAYTRDDVAAYALGPVVAVALHLQGAVLLHAAAMVMKGKALLFAGGAGSGKSTTAAILQRLGYGFLSDDVTEIADGSPLRALSSQPSIRLWPDVVDALYGAEAAFPDRAPSWTKKTIVVPPGDGPCDIAAILFLDSGAREAAARLDPLGPREGWLRLIADAYTGRLPDAAMAGRIFEVTSALADQVPMFAFAPPPIGASDGLGAFLERELDALLR